MNGRKSAGKRMRHLDMRYFFVTDQVKGNVSIQYQPTDNMTGDYKLKPLQGRKFIKHRTTIQSSVELLQRFTIEGIWVYPLEFLPDHMDNWTQIIHFLKFDNKSAPRRIYFDHDVCYKDLTTIDNDTRSTILDKVLV